ncbi:MBL fold metallo-hydrolase [Sphingomonas sp. GCM10030256]|uniref:MBL fold metallo-hydrolase n=1 Tax=Sphingomonas sp. GCM10030256 TaxID=3273427 RepID=UPI0036168104
MRIHHLNCGTCCPWGGRLFDGESRGLLHGHIVCHCLLIESDAGLVLIDTGVGRGDIRRRSRLSKFFRSLNQPQFREEETAAHQIRSLGFRAEDVRHIIISHLDFDHAGGLEDFPNAAVHLTAREKEVADEQRGGAFVGTRRYRPVQWDEVENWKLYPMGRGERWMGFDAVRDLDGLPPEILLVPLAGHTWGHSGVAIDTGAGWLFYAADAYFHHGEVGSLKRSCTPGMRFYQRMMEVDRSARLANQARLRRLSVDHAGDVRLFCAHDLAEFDRMAAKVSGD